MFRTAPKASPPVFTREPWFEALDGERKAAFVARHEAELARDAELARGHRREFWLQAVPMALCFTAAELLSPHGTVYALLLAPLLGAAVGLACERMGFGRFRTAALAAAVFLALEIATRGGLAGRHFFVLFLLEAAAAWIGWKREEREYG